jgi:outer membrane protein OmpA-like peptidoglycan-associated protein/tetratricopeptide (TPR) repeat protein
MVKIKFQSIFTFLLLFTASSLFSQSASKLFKQGQQAFAEGKQDEALDLYSKAILANATNDEYYVARGQLLDQKKETDKALLDYILALQYNPVNDWVYMRVADIYASKNNYPEAILTMKKLLSNSEGSNMAYQKLLNFLLLQKDFPEIIKVCDWVIANFQLKDDFAYHFKMAIACDSLKNYSRAADEYSKAIQTRELLDGKNLQLHLIKPLYLSYALSAQKANLTDESLRLFSKALELDPTDTVQPSNADVYFYRSDAYNELNDNISSINDLNKAIKLKPEVYKYYNQRALVYQKTKQYLDAVKDYDIYLAKNMEDAVAIANRGFCNSELENLTQAQDDYKRAFDLSHKTEYYTSFNHIKKRLLEKNKETDAPEIVLEYPLIDKNGYINIIEKQYEVVVKGVVKDKSEIESVFVNNIPSKLNTENGFTSFTCHVPVYGGLPEVEIIATDMYANKASKNIKVGLLNNNSRKNVTFEGTVLVDDGSDKAYSNKDLSLVNIFDEVFLKSTTDDNGKFKFENLPLDQNYFLKMDVSDSPYNKDQKFKVLNNKGEAILKSTNDGVEKFKFQILPTDVNVLSAMTMEDEPVLIDIRGKLKGNDANNTPIANISLSLLNEKGDVVANKKTDKLGAFLFSKLLPKGDYSIRTNKEETQKLPYDKIILTNDKDEKISEISKGENGTFEYKIIETDKFQLAKISETDPWLSTIKFKRSQKELVIIENIYYPSASTVVSPEAEAIIDKAIEAMNVSNDISIEVQSHTDAVAGDAYNMDLSQKRANAVVNYMVSKGIDKNRLSSKGFGETQLTNRCGNGVDCSDEEHRQNRRTAFKIIFKAN